MHTFSLAFALTLTWVLGSILDSIPNSYPTLSMKSGMMIYWSGSQTEKRFWSKCFLLRKPKLTYYFLISDFLLRGIN